MSKNKHLGRRLVITVAGQGRSTQAKLLAEAFNLRYVSTGTIFRERADELGLSLEELNVRSKTDPGFDKWLDERARDETLKGNVVLDATLSGSIAEKPDIRIFLKTPFDVRVQRIAEREGFNMKHAEEETRIREAAEKERFKHFYDIDIDDLSIYDLVLNTGLFGIDDCAHILKTVVEDYQSNR
jgi:cytidylate kinase